MWNCPFCCLRVSGYIILCGVFMSYCVFVLYLTCSKQQLLLGGKEGLASPATHPPVPSLSPSSKKKKKCGGDQGRENNSWFWKDFHLIKVKEDVCIPVNCQATKVAKEEFRADKFLSSVSGSVIPSRFASFPLCAAFFPVYWKYFSTPFFQSLSWWFILNHLVIVQTVGFHLSFLLLLEWQHAMAVTEA